jgi:hypothetical protein
MRWSPLLSVAIGLSIAAGRLLAEETAVDRRPDTPDPRPPSLLRDTTAVHFQLILGRLQLDPVCYRKGSHNRQLALPDNTTRTESFAVDARRGMPTLHYFSQGPHRILKIDADDRGRVQLESCDRDGSRVIVNQQIGRPISIRRISGERTEEQSAATWIHFYVAAPELYRDHFEPLLDDLLHPVRLCELAEQAHTRSIAEIVRSSSLDAADWSSSGLAQFRVDDPTLQQWVASLGSSSRAERIDAERRLHEQGISLLPRLQQVDQRSLDAEQLDRLSRLIRQLTPRSEDNEARLASFIRDDSMYWAAADKRLSESERTLIAARLQGVDSGRGLRVAVLPAVDGIQHR